MKNKLKILLFVLPLLLALSGCTETISEQETLRDKLGRTSAASKVVCAASLYSGAYLLSEDVVVYEMTDSGAAFTRTLTTLSDDISASELYETVTTTASVSEADFLSAARLPFDETKAAETENGGAVELRTDDPAAFFGSDEATAFMNVTAAVQFEYDRPVSCSIGFTLQNGNTVSIVYTFTY